MAIFNVLEYGATANDLTDDSAAIQAAIDAAFAEGGGTVYVPAGTFLVSGDPLNPSAGCIEVRSNVTLTGDGAGETIIKLVDDFNLRINGIVRTPVDESAVNITISDLTIDGNRANNTEHQAGIITGVKANEDGKIHQDITISGVEVMNCNAYGINPHEITYDLVIEDCVSHDNGRDGFVADYIVGGVYRNNTAYGNDRHGFNIQNSSSDILLENNTAYDNGHGTTGGAGVVVQRSDIFPAGQNTIPWVTNVRIVGGEYYGNTREGILIKLSDDVEVTGVSVHDNMRQGVRVEGATGTVIHGNEIYNNSREALGTYDEINIRLRLDDAVTPPRTYYSTGTHVYQNDIHSDGGSRYGIREELSNSTAGNPSGTAVYGNTVTGTATGDIYVPPYSATLGDDYFYGTTSADSFAGLAGNDTYIVNHTGDTITEQANDGTDTAIAKLNFTLSANVENLILTGSAARGTGNSLNNTILGNAIDNELEGLEGDDILDGGIGGDTMQGGDGNDTYYVDNALDLIIEKDHAGLGGIDTVYSSINYTLAAEVEKVVLLGTGNINATGNNLANDLVGNAGDNILDGHTGADTMRGGLGNDVYMLDHTGDVVTELAGEGTDTVQSSLTYTLGVNVENLTLTGVLQRDGTGNAMNNVIKGNDGINRLHGMDGDDVIEGGLGADQLYGDAGNDTFVMRKGEFAGDIIEDFTGNGGALGDSIFFTGFSSDAVLVNIGGDTWQVQDGTYVESFRVKVPVGQLPFQFGDYSFDGVIPTNSAPVASVVNNTATGTEDVTVIGTLPAGSDVDGDVLTYALVAPVNGLTLNANGTYSFAAPTNQSGDFTFQYVVKDVHGAQSSPQTFTVSVAAVNDIPVAAAIGNGIAGDEDTTIAGSVPAAMDADGDLLSYSLVSPVTGLTLNTDGTFSYRPLANHNGDVTFQYVARDGFGGQTAPQLFTISVRPVNDAPVASVTGNSVTGAEDTLISGSLPAGSDIEGDSLSYGLVAPVAGLTLNANGTFSFNPPANQTGDFTFQYFARDSNGGQSAVQTFTIKVAPVNDAPVASASGNTLAGREDTVATGKVPAGSDVDGGPLTYKLVSPVTGLDFKADGSFTYTPVANANGNVAFQYKVVDASGLESAAQSFTISLAAVNDAPVAGTTGNAASGKTNSVISGTLPTGADIEGHALTYIQVGTLSGLTLQPNGSFSYASTGVSGTFTFQYVVKDALGAQSAPQTFTIKVTPPTNLTVTGDDNANTLRGGEGNDTINGGQGADLMYGYSGNDTYYIDNAKDRVVEAVDRGTDRILTTTSFTLADTVHVETMQATGSAAVNLTGNGLANKLVGNSAINTLNGGAGHDKLDGRLGNDTLTGGAGRDEFAFSTTLRSTNVDTITDFSVVADTIVLSKSIFSALATGTVSQASFVKGTRALDANDRIIYNSSTGQLFYDDDGTGSHVAVHFATLGKGLDLTYLDFVVRDDPIV